MKKSKRNTTILIIITIAVFLVAVLGATFAYFATSEEVENAIIANVETAGKTYQFTAASNGNIEMNIAFNEMSEAGVSNTFLKNANATIDVSLASPTNDTLTTCTYDIVWVWDDGDMYTIPDKALPFTNNEKTYNYEFSVAVDNSNEIDLSKVTKKDDKTLKLQEGLSITSESIEAITKTHEIKANIYNLPVEQTNLFNKNFKAHVTIDNLNCIMSNTKQLAVYIKEDVYNSPENQMNIANKASGLYYHASDVASPNYLTNGAADNTYRYAGADADVRNYVCFLGDDCTNEDNLYRIISVDSNSNQTKVIKATKLENDMPWNSAGINTWEGSSLERYLNGEYLTSLREKANKIVETTWKVGGFTTTQRDSSTPKQIYELEKTDTTTYSNKKIGLMYASEYGFAALPEYWTYVLVNNSANGYNLSKGKDWILTSTDNYPWTISRVSDITSNVFRVSSNTGALGRDNVNDSYGVRPSFALSSDVRITNATVPGVGSKTNPMIIV